MSLERWCAVPGFYGLYEVSDLGRVRSLDRTILRAGLAAEYGISENHVYRIAAKKRWAHV